MLCQAILSAVVVTYLVCVLILSGIQKDDLEPNMLMKLQRHNVNIDDLNNDKLQQTCKKINLDGITKITVTSPDYTTLKSEESSINTTTAYESLNSRLISVRQTFINKARQTDEHINEDHTNKIPTTKEHAFHRDEIEYDDGKPKIDSVLKFWNSYVKSNRKGRSEVTSYGPSSVNDIPDKNNSQDDQKVKLNIHKDVGFNNTDIDKIMTNFLLKKRNENYIITTPTNALNVYEEILSAADGSGKTTNELDKTYSPGNVFNETAFNNDAIFQQKDTQFSEIYSQETTQDPYMSFKDILAAIDQKTAYPFQSTNEFENFEVKNKISKNFDEDTLSKPTNNLPNRADQEASPVIPSDIMIDIVNNIKAIILKDLRNEMHTKITTSTTTRSTTTTTHLTTTETTKYLAKSIETTTNKDNQTVQETVFRKFIELFGQISKAKDEKTHQNVIVNTSLRGTKKQLKEINSHSNFKMSTKPLPYLMTNESYNYRPQIHKFRSISLQKNTKNCNVFQKGFPITIQTNALEIPPLGVFLNKPDNPISQNIIITSSSPYGSGKNNQHAHSFIADTRTADTNFKNHVYSDSFAGNHSPYENINKVDLFVPKSTFCSTHDCSHKSKLSDDRNIASDDFQYASYIDANSDRFRAHVSDLTRTKKPINTSRFHEKLERSVGDSKTPKPKTFPIEDCCEGNNVNLKQLNDCCGLRIQPRAQMSLNPTKQVYDDTHFKNFLKSQQKVTDMLERILAGKNKLRSVEII